MTVHMHVFFLVLPPNFMVEIISLLALSETKNLTVNK